MSKFIVMTTTPSNYDIQKNQVVFCENPEGVLKTIHASSGALSVIIDGKTISDNHDVHRFDIPQYEKGRLIAIHAIENLFHTQSVVLVA